MMAHEDKVSNKCDYALYAATQYRAGDRSHRADRGCLLAGHRETMQRHRAGWWPRRSMLGRQEGVAVQGMRSRHRQVCRDEMTSGASRQLSSDWAAAGAASRSDRGGQAKVRRSGRVTSLVTASGGIARAAYVRALSAGLAVGGLLKNAGLTRAQIRKPDVRIPVRSQAKIPQRAGRASQR